MEKYNTAICALFHLRTFGSFLATADDGGKSPLLRAIFGIVEAAFLIARGGDVFGRMPVGVNRGCLRVQPASLGPGPP